jgi:hypothetical protein
MTIRGDNLQQYTVISGEKSYKGRQFTSKQRELIYSNIPNFSFW